jgi:hypothetical protein
MSSTPYARELLDAGAVRLASKDGSFTFSRPRAGTLLIRMIGHDTGQFGAAALDEITAALNRGRPLELFVDASETISVAWDARTDWTRYFATNRASFTAVHVLTSTKPMHLTIAVAQHFSDTGHLIRLYSDAQLFKARLDKPL